MVQQLKAALREKLLKKRNALSADEVRQMSGAIAERLLVHPRFKEAKTVGVYLPKGNEADTKSIIEAAWKLKKTVCAPVTDHTITFYQFSSFEDLKEGKFGILEPKTRNAHAKSKPPKPKTQNTEPSEPDIILVPGVAFGLCMHRLGYGKGYYDKHLAKSRAYRIGICFDFQVMESLPKHEDDQRMDEILTDKRAIPM